nr:hypothetical protein 18 [Elusimicrobiota bacterium]
MSFNGLLNIRCNIQEKIRAQSPDTGQIEEVWADVAMNIRCRLDEATGQEFKTKTSQYVKATHVLFIKETGGINLIESKHKIVIDGNSYNILLVKNAGGHNHHKEVLLERVF